MRRSNKATVRRRRKVAARGGRACRSVEGTMTAIIRRFDRADPTPPTKEIQLMTKEERQIYVRSSGK
jgi:hypothetical protein